MVLVLTFFMDIGRSKPYLFVGALSALTILGVHRSNAVFGSQLNGSAVLRQRRAPIQWWIIILAVVNTLTQFHRKDPDPYVLIVWWWFVAYVLIMALRLKRRQPAMYAIRGKELLTNGGLVPARDLSTLSRVEFNGVFRVFRLRFKNAGPISIEQGKYKEEELDAFLQHVLRTAGHNVGLSANLRHLNGSARTSAR